ncbi:phosphotransferase [Thalassotalea psychrophila]|uniref:Phosphotransferase n=1 Tax=Thalassotalea psychrophila TaxID=3065647 RepID=A0ABY9TNN0_9GAMM|nr:phosphotransferase [Colwelliaceae bacterium SQ149]
MLSLDDILSTSLYLDRHVQVVKLSNGLSHQCFKVTKQGVNVFLKVFLKKTDISAEQWQLQIDVQTQAANIGLGPKIIESSYVKGYLITEFIDGKSLRLTDLSLPHKLSHAAKVIYQCQQLKSSMSVFQPQSIISHLLTNAKLSDEKERRIKHLSDKLLSTLSIDHNRLVLSHGDVNFDNIMVYQQLPWLIDWEYCVLAEPEFDLGMCLAINNIDHHWHQSLISHFNSHSAEIQHTAYSATPTKVTRYYEISIIINALWFYSQKHQVRKTSLGNLHQQSIYALDELLSK